VTPRALLAHLALAAVALVFAWVQGHAAEEKKGGPSSTVLFEAKKGEVTSVTYGWPRGTTRVSSKGAEAGRAVVVELDRELEVKDGKSKKKKPDTPADKDGAEGPAAEGAAAEGAAEAKGDAEVAPAAPAREQARFPGGRGVMGALEGLEPLKTRRSLGPVDADRLTAMGLASPERTLTLSTASGRSLTIEIGESAYGGQGRYARVKGQDAVHLLENTLVTGLEGGADTLMEKRMVPAGVEDILGFAARLGDKERAFVHNEREQAARRRFVPKEDRSSVRDEPGKVMTTLRNLRAHRLAADPAVAGSAVAAFIVDIDGRAPLKVEVIERIDAEGHLVRSDGWLYEVSETQAKELLEDLAAALE
jgi:hypothetical protein